MWHLYMLRLEDDSLYTGITKNVERRLKQHREGNGSKYVRSRLPFRLVYKEKIGSRSEALKKEAEIKSWRKEEKEEYIENYEEAR
mgnify:CR=1 FL=1